MKIKEIIRATATLLGKEAVAEYLADGYTGTPSQNTLSEVDLMTRLCNLSINELAAIIPMVYSESVQTIDGKVRFSSLTRKITRIKEVVDGEGESMFYVIHPEYISVRAESVTVTYEYMPDNYGLTDDVGYTAAEMNVSSMSCGLAAEVCLAEGRFEEAVMWRRRFTESAEKYALPKNGRIKSRCWL